MSWITLPTGEIACRKLISVIRFLWNKMRMGAIS